jgi:hypothetical protein
MEGPGGVCYNWGFSTVVFSETQIFSFPREPIIGVGESRRGGPSRATIEGALPWIVPGL